MTRNEQIIARFIAGESSPQLGLEFGISRQRVCQIVGPHIPPGEGKRRSVLSFGLTSAGRAKALEAKRRKGKIRDALESARLLPLINADLSFSEIAERTGTTRGAVAGKLWRLGLKTKRAVDAAR